MSNYDVAILTESRYIKPAKANGYVQNILKEDGLLKKSLEKLGLRVTRKDWADPDFDWTTTRSIVFRTTWDYFDRIDEFKSWLGRVEPLTQSFNPIPQIRWNMDKWYLKDLSEKGIKVVQTQYLKRGEKRPLQEILNQSGWEDAILKPTVAGAARHTYRINSRTADEHEGIFSMLIEAEDMMLQPFQKSITVHGEVSFMVLGGEFTHAVLKKAKNGDFRVQDDFGGSVHPYSASIEEIRFAESVVQACDPLPAYARVDVMWDNEGDLVVSELELVEPELWFRESPEAAEKLASVINSQLL